MLNNLLNIKIKNRIKAIEKAIENPIDCQNKILCNNIRLSKKTIFGKKHFFSDIKTYSQYIKNVAIHDYNKLKPYINISKENTKNVLWPGFTRWFAKSSGTTQNTIKYIPVTSASLNQCHFKAGKDMLSIYLNNHPNSKILTGKSLMIGGSSKIKKNNKYYEGDLSAIIIKNLPIWVHLKRVPSIKTALMEDWEKKIDLIIQESIKQNITSISGVPSWTIFIMNQLIEKHNITYLNEIWPNLELYIHGGVNFENYRQSFSQNVINNHINYLEIYNASEGFFGIQDNAKKSDLLLLINHGVFYEFIPIYNGKEQQSKIIPLELVDVNTIYAIVITTNGGLWRYKIGDTVQFVSLKPYKIVLTGRTQSFINAFGEELNEDNTNKAITYACQKTNCIVHEYVAGPLFYINRKGCHEWIVEFNEKPKNLKKFVSLLDEKLQLLNSDYKAKRYKNILLQMPIVHCVNRNFFYKFMKNKNKIGGQNKIRRLYNNRDIITEILKKINLKNY
tara:strand:- start:581 stop:2092 length:1512 start_codon:yes stop_codon:yes gene_type:complete